MPTQQHRWVNVLGDGAAIGVYVTNELAEQVEIYGDHTHRGDSVEVVGIVNIACDQHGGEFDVHAEEFRVIEPGDADRASGRAVERHRRCAGVRSRSSSSLSLQRERTFS